MDSTKPLAKFEDHVYEDIDPKMEWVKNDGFDTLLVHLPGFTKQQIKIQANTGEQKLKITGESHQGDNKWIRFKKKLTVSSDYDLNQVRARFAGGVLYIKHPKKITSPTKPVQDNNADPSVEPQKPAKPDDQNSGQDPAAQEVPPKTEVKGQTRGDIDGKTNATSTEANLKDQKSDYILPEEGKATGTSEKHETDGGGGLVANKKQLRISPTVFVSTGLFVLVIVLALALGLYVRKAMRFHGEYES
ncbi:PREDICTED: inactive protein RESTRICTED TEV MOVEMENT 2-like [Populus euphratica]|uniref:Inactive protein RESTRICTED TEV MOVEMENT 2-like n=1 Tax=Populus euphratica TaxID=75702 RepID=A0AAJ6VA96_POPEU|nr:PREDICTED: inactive protein RESTRICTED TEV MOVEMENT 2-like [Populus euphratica]